MYKITFEADPSTNTIICHRENGDNVIYNQGGIEPIMAYLPAENQQEWRDAVAQLGW